MKPSVLPAAFPKAVTARVSPHCIGPGTAARGRVKVVRLRLKNGVPTGEYEDFLLGFVTPGGDVWGRPVGLTEAGDGSLLVSDDAGNVIWRVAYGGRQVAAR